MTTTINYTANPPVPTADGLSIITWTELAAGDVGQVMTCSSLADKTVHIFGTFGGTVTIQGSNDPLAATAPASASWVTLTDNFGNPLAVSAITLATIAQAPLFIQPLPGSGVSSVTVVIAANAN